MDKRSEEEKNLKLENEHLNELIEKVPTGIGIYEVKDGQIYQTYMNEAFYSMLGMDRESRAQYEGENTMNAAHPDDVPAIHKAMYELLSGKDLTRVTYRLRFGNDKWFWVNLAASVIERKPNYLKVYAAFSDCNAMMKMQRKYEEQLRLKKLAAQEALATATYNLTKNRIIEFESSYPEFRDIMDKENADDVLRGIRDAVADEKDWAEFEHIQNCASMIHAFEQGITHIAIRHRLKNYQGWVESIFDMMANPYNDNIEAIGVLVDVTETIEQEEMQRVQLQRALDEAQKANQAKTAFLSRVSHDMRTPLNGILGLTTLIKENVQDKKILKDLSELEMSGQYLLNLINDTLDVSRIESGKLELHPTVCDGRTLFNNSIGLAKTSIQEKNIQCHLHADNLPFTTLYVDVDRIQQVVMNILGNAVKFTPKGGRIDVFMKNISIENGIITDEMIIQDNGVGMSPEFLPHIFEAFSQEDATRTSSYHGTGLGMSITKQILEIMGGSITIESELGKSTRVIITVPLRIATDEQIAQWKENQCIVEDDVILEGKRILLCEDHPLNAAIATRLLDAKGVVVEHAENGKVGVQMFADSTFDYYDAVLMDIRMPVMDGLDASREIRNLSRRDARCVPIIAMTANVFEEDIRQTKDAGMDAHLGKPIQKEILYATLDKLLEKRVEMCSEECEKLKV